MVLVPTPARPINLARLFGESGKKFLRALVGRAERDRPLFKPDLVGIGEDDFTLAPCLQDDALLIFNLN